MRDSRPRRRWVAATVTSVTAFEVSRVPPEQGDLVGEGVKGAHAVAAVEGALNPGGVGAGPQAGDGLRGGGGGREKAREEGVMPLGELGLIGNGTDLGHGRRRRRVTASAKPR